MVVVRLAVVGESAARLSCAANAFLPLASAAPDCAGAVGVVLATASRREVSTGRIKSGVAGRGSGGTRPYPRDTSDVRAGPLGAERADDRGDLAGGAGIAGRGHR